MHTSQAEPVAQAPHVSATSFTIGEANNMRTITKFEEGGNTCYMEWYHSYISCVSGVQLNAR